MAAGTDGAHDIGGGGILLGAVVVDHTVEQGVVGLEGEESGVADAESVEPVEVGILVDRQRAKGLVIRPIENARVGKARGVGAGLIDGGRLILFFDGGAEFGAELKCTGEPVGDELALEVDLGAGGFLRGGARRVGEVSTADRGDVVGVLAVEEEASRKSLKVSWVDGGSAASKGRGKSKAQRNHHP